MREPNLFDFATSELSQDAFICWLLSWAKPGYHAIDKPLNETACEFLRKLLEVGELKSPPARYESIEIKPQHKGIDILVLVNDDIALIIEDKTNTQDHSDQLRRYRNTIAKGYPHRQIAAVYLKTGDQSEYQNARMAGYGCFLRQDFLKILDGGSRSGVKNDIYDAFACYLHDIENAIQSFATLPPGKWERDQWKGFYIILKEKFVDSKWEYRGHSGGGAFSFHWHRRGDKFLLLHEAELRFKIDVNDESEQRAERDRWLESLLAKNGFDGVRIKRKDRLGLGNRMTVAVLEGNYLKTSESGLVDLDATVEMLKTVEKLMDAALESA